MHEFAFIFIEILRKIRQNSSLSQFFNFIIVSTTQIRAIENCTLHIAALQFRTKKSWTIWHYRIRYWHSQFSICLELSFVNLQNQLKVRDLHWSMELIVLGKCFSCLELANRYHKRSLFLDKRDAWRDLVPFVQFRNRGKHQRRGATFSKAAD